MSAADSRMIAERLRQQQNACMVSITIRDVPEETRNRWLRGRPGAVGRSRSTCAVSVEIASRPDRAAVLARMTARVKRDHGHVTVDEILEARDADKR